MPTQFSPDIERRALALFERLAEQPDNTRLRARLLKNEAEAVRARFGALESSAMRAANAIPTLIPGSADAGEAALPPARVGAFRLTDRIGRGGMGDVWAGQRDDGLYEQKVAIKLIQRHALHRAAVAFDDERRFLARLEHPNIARLIDGGVTDEGLPWLVLEYVEGRPIDEAAEDLSDAERIRMIVKAADAVQYAHSRMVAHADLKPSNILVDTQGRVKLLDFGISALIGGDARTSLGSGPLTREFASPQRIAGEGPSVSDDVYALGKTMGRVLANSTDNELRAIVAKAHHADPLIRYGSAAALIADLDRWRARLPVSALPDGWRYRASKFVERHRTGVAATGVAIALLSTSSLIATSSYVRAERNRVGAEARFGEVRHLSGFMLYDLYDELARQPGTVAKRAQIAETSALYLDRLQVAADAPTDLRLETARSYRRLAAIQGMPGTSNLGQPDKALVSLKRAEGLLQTLITENPGNAAAEAQLGWVFSDRWTLHAEGDPSSSTNPAARAAFDKALALNPADPLARLGKLQAEASAAYDLIWSADKPTEALPRARNALTELRKGPWPRSYSDVVAMLEIQLLNRIGDATYYTDNIPGSLNPYREADALTDRMIASKGAIPAWLIRKGENAFNISGSLGDMGGHNAEALAVARNGISSLRQLLGFGPDAAAEKKLLVLLGQEAAVLDEMGRIREALAPSLASVTLREQRLLHAPDNPQRLRDLAIGITPYAELLAKAGEHQKACEAATRSVAIWTEIRDSGQLGALDARKNLPHSGMLKEKFCQG
ncbi:MAG: serine/threonine-protein kinase [Sphingomonadales bacterium]